VGPQRDGEGLVELELRTLDLGKILGAQDRDSDGIVEDEWLRVVQDGRAASMGSV